MSYNQLTPAQVERLALLAEACGEVLQSIGKVLRQGYDSRDIERGLGNIVAVGSLMRRKGDLNGLQILFCQREKEAKLPRGGVEDENL